MQWKFNFDFIQIFKSQSILIFCKSQVNYDFVASANIYIDIIVRNAITVERIFHRIMAEKAYNPPQVLCENW